MGQHRGNVGDGQREEMEGDGLPFNQVPRAGLPEEVTSALWPG